MDVVVFSVTKNVALHELNLADEWNRKMKNDRMKNIIIQRLSILAVRKKLVKYCVVYSLHNYVLKMRLIGYE